MLYSCIVRFLLLFACALPICLLTLILSVQRRFRINHELIKRYKQTITRGAVTA
jgi:hypothetical protein